MQTRSRWWRALISLAMTAAMTPAIAQGKLATDPNATKPAEIAKPLAVGATDKRLDQEVTYYKGNVRLHDVVYALSELSGVQIYCGKSNEDWQTRDIPVTVAASQISLRKMLEYITCCTNTVLTSKKTEKGDITYMVVLNPRLKRSIESFTKARAEHIIAWERQHIEVAAKLKDIPASQITPPSNAEPDWAASMSCQREASKVLSELTEEQIGRILAGEPLVFSPKDAPADMRAQLISCLDAFDEVYLADMRMRDPGDESANDAQRVTTADLEKSRLRIARDSIGLTVTGCVTPPDGDRDGDRISGYGLSSITRSANDYNRGNFTPPAELVYPKVPEAELPGKHYKALTEGMTGFPETVTLKLDDKDKPATSADILIALSKAGGMPIICTDFLAHSFLRDYSKSFGIEKPFTEAVLAHSYNKWMVDTQTNAIVGTDNDWVVSYQQLIPASIVENLTAKAYGDGVELDDLAQLASCDKQGVLEWINSRIFPDFPDYGFSTSPNATVWAIYDSLSSRDKAHAKNETGHPMAKSDIAIIEKWLTDKIKINAADLWMTPDRAAKSNSELNRLLDPAVLPNLVLSIVSEPTRRKSRPTTATSAAAPAVDTPITIPPGFTNPTRYTLYIVGSDKGGEIRHRVDSVTLPYFHPDREKVLTDALRKQALSTQPN